MRIKLNRGVMTVLAVAIVALAGSAMADSFFKQVVHSDAFEMMGQKQPETNDTTTMWLSGGKACSQSGTESATIFDGDKGVMYMVDHAKKEYIVVPMDLFGTGEGGEEAEQSEEMKQMMAMAQAMMGSVEVTVTPTEETMEIGDWTATKYDVEMSMAMMKMNQEMWATEDIEIDYTLFHAITGGDMAKMPGFDKIVEQMKQVKGMPIKTTATVSMMGQEMVTTTEIIEYAEKDAPEGIFEVPEGYKKTEMSMGMGGR